MKKLTLMALAAVAAGALLLSGSTVQAEGSGAGIAGSPHDFSVNTGVGGENAWNTREEICRTCHVPHDHQRDIYQLGLLWNHSTSNATYTTYTLDDGTVVGQPDGTSKLCLSCHDGTVGIDDWDGQNTGAGTVFMNDYDPDFQVPGNITAPNDLSRTHPLSVVYDFVPGEADEMNDPATTPMGTSGVIDDVLDNGKVQCSSCHDVHDNESVANTHLLRVSQKASQGQASGLCLSCHNK